MVAFTELCVRNVRTIDYCSVTRLKTYFGWKESSTYIRDDRVDSHDGGCIRALHLLNRDCSVSVG